jgi:hypothetical protein
MKKKERYKMAGLPDVYKVQIMLFAPEYPEGRLGGYKVVNSLSEARAYIAESLKYKAVLGWNITSENSAKDGKEEVRYLIKEGVVKILWSE